MRNAGGKGAPDVSKLLRDARVGANVAAAAEAKAKPTPSQALSEENAQLRREVAELRQQLMVALSAPAPPAVTELSPQSVAWLSAQLEQGRRQVQVLSDALVQRSEMSTELEAVLLKLRQPAADGTRHEGAEWAAAAMRRLRHVQFAEELAGNLQSLRHNRAAAGKGGRGHRSAAGRGPPGGLPQSGAGRGQGGGGAARPSRPAAAATGPSQLARGGDAGGGAGAGPPGAAFNVC